MKSFGFRECSQCGKKIEIFHKVRLERENCFCSKKCESEFRKSKILNGCCPICGKMFHVKPYHKKKCKNNYCSMECFIESKKESMKGENNHQFGLKGEKNASWKSNKKVTNYGYIKVRCIDHPFKDCDDMIFEHRLVAEKYLLNENNSIEINGKRYLKKEYIVHHKDGNRKNNNVDNLEIMLLSDHTKLHHKQRKLVSLN